MYNLDGPPLEMKRQPSAKVAADRMKSTLLIAYLGYRAYRIPSSPRPARRLRFDGVHSIQLGPAICLTRLHAPSGRRGLGRLFYEVGYDVGGEVTSLTMPPPIPAGFVGARCGSVRINEVDGILGGAHTRLPGWLWAADGAIPILAYPADRMDAAARRKDTGRMPSQTGPYNRQRR